LPPKCAEGEQNTADGRENHAIARSPKTALNPT